MQPRLHEFLPITPTGKRNQDALLTLKNYEDMRILDEGELCIFMAAICLYIAAKYLELHYPVIEDLCTLFGLKSSKEVFIEME